MKHFSKYILAVLMTAVLTSWTMPDPIEPGYHRVTVTANPAEGATALGGADDYLNNTDILPYLTQTPAAGYTFLGWYVDGVLISGTYPLTATCTVEARYDAPSPSLQLCYSGGILSLENYSGHWEIRLKADDSLVEQGTGSFLSKSFPTAGLHYIVYSDPTSGRVSVGF